MVQGGGRIRRVHRRGRRYRLRPLQAHRRGRGGPEHDPRGGVGYLHGTGADRAQADRAHLRQPRRPGDGPAQRGGGRHVRLLQLPERHHGGLHHRSGGAGSRHERQPRQLSTGVRLQRAAHRRPNLPQGRAGRVGLRAAPRHHRRGGRPDPPRRYRGAPQ